AALLDDGGQAYVYVVTGGVAHRRDITVGAPRGDRVAVSGAVLAGEAVVVAGGTAVEDGMKVRTK
ncbi:efflux RND transporter periplasmic adaptor subunit, partial [Sphingomonas sp. HMWF008]